MSGISVQIDGIDQFIGNLDALVQAKGQEVNDRIQEAGIDTHSEVVSKWPVGTPESTHKKHYHGGRSRQSFQYIPGNMECSVGSDVFYSKFINDGTYKMAARPILTNAFIKNRASLMSDLGEMFNS